MDGITPKNKTPKNKRALSVANVLNYKPEIMPFEGKWRDAIGLPEIKGAWMIFGESGEGKTSFAMQLGRYFCQLGKRVAYNSIEEGISLSIQDAYRRTGMSDVSGRFLLLDKDSIPELTVRLRQRRSPDVIIIDSIQYSALKNDTYKELVDLFPKKLFVFISHADGLKPKGATAQGIYYDAFVCIYIKGFVAFVRKSRYGGSGQITISEHEAGKYEELAQKKDNINNNKNAQLLW